jgi:hypothetical protein
MAGITIDWMQLELAFESHAPDQLAFLNKVTGEVRLHLDGEGDGNDDNPDLIRIEAIPSREQYRMMERFIATVINVPLKEALQDAIVGKGAFRRFKDAVSRHPDERKRWFAFRDALLHRYILDWLKTHKLELQEIPAWNLELPMTPSPEPSEPSTPPSLAPEPSAPVASERAEFEALRGYLHAWARSHGDEYRYLFGPAAFERLAADITQEFNFYRKRGP